MKKQILPIGRNIIIQPYKKNPYLQTETEGGVILSDGDFLNPDSGEVDKLKQDFLCAEVLEVGEETKFVKVGDDIIFNINVALPIPFMNHGFLLITEGNVMAVINDNFDGRVNK